MNETTANETRESVHKSENSLKQFMCLEILISCIYSSGWGKNQLLYQLNETFDCIE